MISGSFAHQREVFIRWTAPPAGIIKLNIDGSCDKNNQMVVGVVFCDASGNWINGFLYRIGVALLFKQKFEHCIWGYVLRHMQLTLI